MKKQSLKVEWLTESWPVGIQIRTARPARLADLRDFGPEPLGPGSLMGRMRRNCSSGQSRFRAFTLIEMLVVIGIIAILASILLPALARGKISAKVAATRTEMGNIMTAIAAYDTDYSRPAASKEAESAAAAAQSDFTFGTMGIAGATQPIVNGPPNYPYNANNSELMVILMNVSQGANDQFRRNPRKTVYFQPKQVSGDLPGLNAETHVMRDPFGNPYIITLDMNDDNKSLDSFYRKIAVSERAPNDNVGLNGLTRGRPGDSFEVNAPAMIWTFGPDRTANDGAKANEGVNKDNVLSWKQ